MHDSSSTGWQATPLPYVADSFSLYERIRHLPLPVLLTSGSNAALKGRFDIIAAAPHTVFRTVGRKTTVTPCDGEAYETDESPLSVLRQSWLALTEGLSQTPDPTLPFPGGILGYFSYELLHPWYGIAPAADDDISLPSMLAGLYTWALIVDHEQRQTRLVTLPACSASLREQVLTSLQCTPETSAQPSFRITRAFQSNLTASAYQHAFERIIDYIHAGDCYQVNLAQRFTAAYEGDVLQAFQHLHSLANAPFSALIEAGDGQAVLSFSPERFLRVQGQEVMTQPIKGTRPRHSDPAEDQALLEDLLGSEKDRAENLMIVDLLRNDLGQVCDTGSVSVPRLFEAQSFNNVHHLVSTVTGTLSDPARAFDLFAASFPGGSITGAPKIRAMEIINELENRPRSVYCGSVAYFGAGGDMDSNICIRTLVCDKGQVHCWGGGGIVADSEGHREYQETFDKISLFIDNLPGAQRQR